MHASTLPKANKSNLQPETGTLRNLQDVDEILSPTPQIQKYSESKPYFNIEDLPLPETNYEQYGPNSLIPPPLDFSALEPYLLPQKQLIKESPTTIMHSLPFTSAIGPPNSAIPPLPKSLPPDDYDSYAPTHPYNNPDYSSLQKNDYVFPSSSKIYNQDMLFSMNRKKNLLEMPSLYSESFDDDLENHPLPPIPTTLLLGENEILNENLNLPPPPDFLPSETSIIYESIAVSSPPNRKPPPPPRTKPPPPPTKPKPKKISQSVENLFDPLSPVDKSFIMNPNSNFLPKPFELTDSGSTNPHAKQLRKDSFKRHSVSVFKQVKYIIQCVVDFCLLISIFNNANFISYIFHSLHNHPKTLPIKVLAIGKNSLKMPWRRVKNHLLNLVRNACLSYIYIYITFH